MKIGCSEEHIWEKLTNDRQANLVSNSSELERGSGVTKSSSTNTRTKKKSKTLKNT